MLVVRCIWCKRASGYTFHETTILLSNRFDNISFWLNISPVELMEQVSKLDRARLFSSSRSKIIIKSSKIVHNNDDNEKA